METSQEAIENLLDLNNSYIKNLYNMWDKGDCSTVGLARLLMIQEIFKQIDARGDHYDGQYDEIIEVLLYQYKT